MKTDPVPQETSIETLPAIPGWLSMARAESLEDAAFLSGAALCQLHLVVTRAEAPQTLLRERLALEAAAVCVGHSGRPERAAALRDGLHLLRPGDLPGPAGEVYQAWRRAVERRVSVRALQRALPGFDAAAISGWLDHAPKAGAIARAAAVLEAVLEQAPQAEVAALILADAVLALALGWEYVLPVLSLGLGRTDLRRRGAALRQACHRAVTRSALEALRLSSDLARRAARLHAVAPKLRAKGAAQAIEMFLTRDALTPTALPLPDRAARRLCDRLVTLGGIQELTGRDSFRLYGL